VGELAINVPDGKIYLRKSGSNGDEVQAAITTNSNNIGNVILSGSLSITGSLSVNGPINGTASYATTASYLTGTIASASYAINASTASLVNTASYALTASFLIGSIQSASYALNASTASYVESAKTASYISFSNVYDITNATQFIGTASYATNATNAASASWVPLPNNLVSSSAQLENNGSVSFTNASNVTFGQITASNAQIVNLTVQYITSSVIVTTGSNKFGNASSDIQEFTGSVEISGSLKVTGSINGNLTGTSSFASQALSSSYSNFASTASYVAFSQTASYVTLAQSSSVSEYAKTASYVQNAQSASYVALAQTASYVTLAQSSSVTEYAKTASYVTLSQTASYVALAQTASYITLAQTASYVTLAQSASIATSASYTVSASFSQTSSLSRTASFVSTLNQTVTISGSLNISGALNFSGDTGSVLFSSNADTFEFTGSMLVSGSLLLAGSIGVTGGITGSLLGTASYSSVALSSSYSQNSSTASYVASAQTASFAQTLASGTKITASGILSTGSNTFGSITSDVHKFTGSIYLSGSIYVNGTEFVSGGETSNITGSLFGTASWARNLVSGTKITSSGILSTGSNTFGSTQTDAHRFTGSIYLSGSIIVNGNEFVSGAETSNITGSLFGTASWARNLAAGTKITASGILSTGSNTFGSILSDIHKFTGSIYLSGSIYVNGNEVVSGTETGTITGSLFGTASWARNLTAGTKITASGILSTGSNIFGSTINDLHRFTGSVSISGSLIVNGNEVANVTGSLFGTASWASRAVTASNANTASYVTWANVYETTTDTFVGTSSYASVAATVQSGININATEITASSIQVTNLNVVTITSSIDYASGSNIFGNKSTDTHKFTGSVSITGSLSVDGTISGTASFATTASNVNYANVSGITSSSTFAGTASIALTASYLLGSISSASYADQAATASYLFGAIESASYALNAGTASYNISSSYALSASYAVSASYAKTASLSYSTSGSVRTGDITLAPTGANNPTITFVGANTSSIQLEVAQTGTVVFNGDAGSLLEIVDSLSGSLLSVNDLSGFPIFEVFSDDRIVAGAYNSNAFVVTGSSVGVGKLPNNAFALDINGNTALTGSINVSAGITGSLFGTASVATSISSGSKISVAAITASAVYASGSNTFGTKITDVHTVTGSMYLSGSLFVNGTDVSNLSGTGSLFGTASWAVNAINIASSSKISVAAVTSSFLYGSGSNIFGTKITDIHRFTGSIYLSGSLIVNGDEVANLSGSLFGTASWALNAINIASSSKISVAAVTSSFLYGSGSNIFGTKITDTHRVTGSMYLSGSLIVNGNEVANVTGSLFGTASWALNAVNVASSSKISIAAITASVVYGSGSNVFGTKQTDSHRFTGSIYLSGSIVINGSEFVSGGETSNITGSLFGTASYAITSSYVLTASYVANAATASYAFVSGSQNYISKYATNNTLGNSRIFDNGTNVGINTNTPNYTLEVSGSFVATSKSFLIAHPTIEGKKLQHGVVEGPEHSVYVRGKIDSDTITLPDYWVALVHEDTITVQLTPIGTNQNLVVKSVSLKKVVIENKSKTAKNINCYYYVQGERKDIPKINVEY